jgi:hypothetical protein
MTLEKLDWAAMPITMDAKPAATSIEAMAPNDSGKAVNVEAIVPTIATARTAILLIMVVVVRSPGCENASRVNDFIKILSK